MNNNRIILGLGAYILCMIFCLQASTIGCSGTKGTDEESLDESSGNHTPFFSNSNSDGFENIVWEPMTDSVLEQVTSLHEQDPISILAIERSVRGPSAIRCVMDAFDGHSDMRDFLNGFYVLYRDFPNQTTYLVEIDGNSYMTSWENLAEFADNGYTFESSDMDLDWYWRMIVEEPEEEVLETEPPMIKVAD